MATCGNVGEYKESQESWNQYAKGLQQCFTAMEIKGAKKQRAMILLNESDIAACYRRKSKLNFSFSPRRFVSFPPFSLS